MSRFSHAGLVARLVVVANLAVACTLAPAPSASPVVSPVSPAHWTYEGEEGPAHWGELSSDYELCGTGLEQSPVDLREPSPADLADISFEFRPAPLEIVNTGHTVQVNYPPGSSIRVEDTTYELVQFHLHAPSEHHVEGQPADAELHLVHRAPDGELAVVGVFIDEGAAHSGLAPVFENLPIDVGTEQAPGVEIDAAALLPATRATYRYAGSLTTPPCSEGVRWLVMTEPIEASPAQLSAFRGVIEGNNRPIQSLNDRLVEEDVTP